jgi:hypothetical protein
MFEEISQRGSATRRYCSSRVVCKGGYVELGTVLVEPILNRLSRHAR